MSVYSIVCTSAVFQHLIRYQVGRRSAANRVCTITALSQSVAQAFDVYSLWLSWRSTLPPAEVRLRVSVECILRFVIGRDACDIWSVFFPGDYSFLWNRTEYVYLFVVWHPIDSVTCGFSCAKKIVLVIIHLMVQNTSFFSAVCFDQEEPATPLQELCKAQGSGRWLLRWWGL